MSDEPPPLPPPGRGWSLLIGMIVANVVGGGLFLGVAALVSICQGAHQGWLVVPNLFLVPLAAGLAAAWCWRRLDRSVGANALDALWTSLLGLAAGAVILREGAVCLVMAFPAIYVMIFMGVLLGRVWFKPDRTKLQCSIFPLLALLTVGDAFNRPDEPAVVTDRILIQAPPEKVWPHVLSFSEIPDRPDYWIFRLGLPYPTRTTNGGDFTGADRQCMFSTGIVIQERIAEFVPREKLTFEIVEQPTHPEAYGHITLHRGQFRLQDNRDGTTTLCGSSWYTLHVRPLWYFDLWTRDMTSAVHLRVMNHVRRLAEARE